MAGLRARWPAMGSSRERKERGKGREEGKGHGCGEEEGRQGHHGGLLGELGLLPRGCSSMLYVRKKK
jgi:hypothetical protein